MGVTITKPKKDIEYIIFDVLNNKVVPVAKEEMLALAYEARQELIDRIEDQSFNHKPLSDDWADRKEKENLDDRILIATRQYIDEGIDVEETPYGAILGVRDTIHQRTRGAKYGKKRGRARLVPMIVIARTLEYGNPKQNIPARPHWRPTIAHLRKMRDSYKGNLTKKLQQVADDAVKQYNKEHKVIK